jgi:small-conductance mechanosensitive channel
MIRFPSWLLLFICFSPLLAQEPDAPTPPAEVSKVEALEALTLALNTEEKDRTSQRELLKKAVTDEQKAELGTEIDRISARIKEIKRNLTTTATGIVSTDTDAAAEAALSLNEELKNIFHPLIRELRQATAQPREIENLAIEYARWKAKEQLADQAVLNVEQLLSEKPSAELLEELQSIKKSWEKKRQEAQVFAANTSFQLGERKRNAPSVVKLLTSLLSNFWKNRGLSLLLAFIALSLVWYGSLAIYLRLRVYSPVHRQQNDSFATRLLDVLAKFAAFFAGIFAAVIVLYVRNDWLLLTAMLILLFGLIWASRTALPPYFEQIRLILNLGTVRQGERVIINGLPWRVDTLNFFCVLRNPDLTGGVLRLPAKTMLSYHSRPTMPKEPWFPSHENDWVKLDDGVFGKIVQQTPDQVVMVKLGGSYKTYVTSAYLAKNPENITPQYRVSTLFGLDYQYQKLATTTVPAIIRDTIYNILVERYDKENIKSVNVEFASASSSSLDFQISADVDGSLASQHDVIKRLLQRGAVDAANENEWVIPFPQLTLHKTDESNPAPTRPIS